MDAINSYLKIGAVKRNACGKEIDTWEGDLTQEELADKFGRVMRFCAETNFPDSKFLIENYSHEFLVSCGVYVNAVGNAKPCKNRVTIMGNSDVTITYGSYDVAALFVRNDSTVNISVAKRAIVHVMAYNNATVNIENLSTESSVKVFSFGNDTKVYTKGNVKTFKYE